MDWSLLLKPLLTRVLRSPSLFVAGSVFNSLFLDLQCISLFVSKAVYRGPLSFTHNMKSHFDQVVDLGEHDNSEIKRAVLPHTESKYERALGIYDKLVPIYVNSTLIMIDI